MTKIILIWRVFSEYQFNQKNSFKINWKTNWIENENDKNDEDDHK